MVARWQSNFLSRLTRTVTVLPRAAVTRTRLRSYATAVTNGQKDISAALPQLLQHDTPAPIVIPSIKLRRYQLDCIDAVIGAFQEGKRHVGVSLATGSGKTVIFTELIDRVDPPTPQATRALILVHRRELVEQAARQCSRRYPEKIVEVEMGNIHASGVADITVASIQSINSQDRIKKFSAEDYKLVLVDEAHHIVSAAYLKALDHFGIPEARPEMKSTPALVGVSATLSRADGVALGKAIKHIVYHKDYIDMIGEKWLSNVIFTTVESTADLSTVKKSTGGDFNTAQLAEAVNQDHINLITVKAWQNRAGDRQSTIVFCVDLKHVESLTKTFRRNGVDARFITGDTAKKIRSDRLDAFKRREFPVLVNCGVYTEGTDIPNIDCVLLARPTKSRNLLVQMIGRGMRLFDGKENCHIIDMVASLQTGIVTVPTLFGLDPSETITSMDPDKLARLRRRKTIERERQQAIEQITADPSVMGSTPTFAGEIKFTDYESVADLIEDTSAETFVRAFSPNAWVNVDKNKYVLMNGAAGDYLVVEKVAGLAGAASPTPGEPDWVGSVVKKLTQSSKTVMVGGVPKKVKTSPLARPREIITATTLEAAIHGADTFATKHFYFGHISLYTLPGRRNWRNDSASMAQVDYLNKYREEGRKLQYGSVTKGRAGDMITKITFGAKGRVQGFINQKKREQKAKEKIAEWNTLQERAKVKVGPVGKE